MSGGNFMEGSGLWNGFSLDKDSLRFHRGLLNLKRVQAYQSKWYVTISNAGGAYWDINFHAEGLVPWLTVVRQVAFWLAVLALDGVFRDDLCVALLGVAAPGWDWDDGVHVAIYIETLRWHGILWVSREVAWDFPTQNRPVRVLEKEAGHKFRSTLYSNDGVRTRRLVEVNGEPRFHSKGRRRDFVAEYNRSRKIGAEDQIWRLELRLQRHHLDRLSMYELALGFPLWLLARIPVLSKYLRKAVEPGTWSIKESEIGHEHFGLDPILSAAGWARH